MRLPRDLSGSHIRLTKRSEPAHHLTIPDHPALRVGTLAAVVADLATHHGLSRDEIVQRLFGIR